MTKRNFGLVPFTLCLLAVTAGACDRHAARTQRSGARDTSVKPPSASEGTRGAGPAESAQASETAPAPAPVDPMATLAPDMRQVLSELQALGAKPIETLTPAQAREQPTPADAVKSLLRKQGKSADPQPVAKVENRVIPGPGGKLLARIYTPTGDGALPVVVYFHGGGFVIADNDAYDATPRGLANGARAIVVSVEYRKAPEQRFPAAHDDANAAYKWVLEHASSFNGDRKRVAVAGESAGGNLAENVAIFARDERLPQPLHVLLIYPIASDDFQSESYVKYADAKPLSKATMLWFTEHYFRSPADAHDLRIDLVNAKLTGLPETTIINAEIDPLLSDGKELAKRLVIAEVPVKQKTYGGVTHEFFGMSAAVNAANDAMKLACERLRQSFDLAESRQATALSR